MSAYQDPCKYATVKMAKIEDVGDAHVAFSTRSSADRLETFEVPLTEILAEPPTDAPEPVQLGKNRVGYLYLSREGWKAKGDRGSTIYRAGDENVTLFKWPLCKPYRLLGHVDVVPRALVVEGLCEDDTPITIDLLGPSAAPAQQIDWNGTAGITIALRRGGTRTVWPKRIVFTGHAVEKPAVIATFDILDATNADFLQRFGWSRPGAPIALKLSITGFGLLMVTPPAIRALARGLAVTYPADLARECNNLRTVVAERDHAEDVHRQIADAITHADRQDRARSAA